MGEERPLPPAGRTPSWPWALAMVAVVAIAAGAALQVFRSARRLPIEVIESGRQALEQLGEVAAAFRQGTLTTSFRSYATTIRGTTRLQLVELKQLEVFERRDGEALLWGALVLPDVVVEARAPVEYAYYVDLEKEWRFELRGRDVEVIAPALEWNAPAVDVSALQYEVRQGSVLRDEQVAQDRLKAELTALAQRRARQNLPLIRERARRQAEGFVENWLLQRFSDGSDYRIRLRFGDEPAASSPPAPRAPGVTLPRG